MDDRVVQKVSCVVFVVAAVEFFYIARVLAMLEKSWNLKSHFPCLESHGIGPKSWKVVENNAESNGK